jgi:hypothetical protein
VSVLGTKAVLVALVVQKTLIVLKAKDLLWAVGVLEA